MNIKYMGEQAIAYLIEKCKSTFALITHKHTASEVGADAQGSASAALVLANQHTDEKIGELSKTYETKDDSSSKLEDAKLYTDTEIGELAINVAYIDVEDNEDVVDPDISMSDITVDSALSETSMNPVQNKVVTAKIKELEENAVTSWNELKDKPFGEGGLIEVEVFQEDSVEFIEYFGLQNTLTTNMVFPVDKQYIITFNGTRYECMSRTSTDGYNDVIIGNGTINGDDNITNGEPFEIVGYNGYNECHVYVQSEGTHTIGISVIDTEIKKIDSKYLPDMDFAGKKVGNGAEIFNYYDGNIASGSYSHAEGAGTTASGDNSHAEGVNTTASGANSHAEGRHTIASGNFSHAEGQEATASGIQSHAEGFFTTASGENAHAEGYGTIASGLHQHVQGKYNIEDTSNTYAHIVGNGENYKKLSNAHTLDWQGNAWYQGTVEATAIILKSSTSGSTKRFTITVDDSGAIKATEITE